MDAGSMIDHFVDAGVAERISIDQLIISWQ
jgi:hypothetical protein